MKIFTSIVLIASLAGIVDSMYLVDSHYNETSACSFDQEYFLGYPIDCGLVDQSSYSEILGIPVALLGFLYYLTLFLVIYFSDKLEPKLKGLNISILVEKTIIKSIFAISFVGFLFTLYFVHIQLNVLEVICKYCMYSALSTSAIFISSIVFLILAETSSGAEHSQ